MPFLFLLSYAFFPFYSFLFEFARRQQNPSKVYYVVSLLPLPQRICTSYPPKWKIDRIKDVVISHICITRIQTRTHQKKKKKILLFGVLYRFVLLLYVCINGFSCFLAHAWELYDVLSLHFNGGILFSIQIKLIIALIQSFEYRFNQFDYFVLSNETLFCFTFLSSSPYRICQWNAPCRLYLCLSLSRFPHRHALTIKLIKFSHIMIILLRSIKTNSFYFIFQIQTISLDFASLILRHFIHVIEVRSDSGFVCLRKI